MIFDIESEIANISSRGKKPISNYLIKKKGLFIIIFLSLIVILCLVLRLIKLGDLSLWMDEGFYQIAADEILHHGYPLYPSGHILFKGILYSYILSFFSIFLGINEFSLRFVSVFASVITLPILYLFAKKFFNEIVAFSSVFILAFSIWETEYSRVAGYYPLLQLFYLLSIYFFYLGFFEGKKKYKYWATAFLIMAPLIHQTGFVLIFLYLYFMLIEGIKKFFRKDCLVSFVIVSSFYVILELNEIFFWKVGYVFTPNEDRIGSILIEYFTNFNLLYFRELRIAFPQMSLIILGSFFLLLGLFLTTKKMARKNQFKKWFYLFLSFAIPLVFTGFIKSHLQPRYVYFLRPVFILLFCYGLYKFVEIIFQLGINLFRFLSKRDPIRAKSYLILPVFVLAFVFTVDGISIPQINQIINREYKDRIQTSLVTRTGRFEHPDHKSAGEFVKRTFDEDDIVIAVHMVFQYIYLGKVDYWLWTGGPGTWDGWEKTEEGWKDVYIGTQWINNLVDLEKILHQHKDNRIWLITSPSIRRRDHISQQVADFLENNSQRIVFMGRDGDSNVYLWSSLPGDQEIKSSGLEAEWFSPTLGSVVHDEKASQKRAVFLDGTTNKRKIASLSPEKTYEPGKYKLFLRLKTDINSNPENLLRTAIFFRDEEKRIFSKSISGISFENNNIYKNFEYKFVLNREKKLEIKILYLEKGNIWIDYLNIVRIDSEKF